MKVMFDLNVIVDIAEAREGLGEMSRKAFEKAVADGDQIYFSLHGFTTLHYLLARAGKAKDSKRHLAWLCDHVSCVPTDTSTIRAACVSRVADFEDAVVDETALVAQCQYVVTRNTRHFAKSRVQAITPERFLSL